MVRPLIVSNDGLHDDLASSIDRLGWLKLTYDEELEHQVQQDAPSSHEPCLCFAAVSTDGGQYSSEHGCDNICKDDKSCYSSELGCSAAINVIAKHARQAICTVQAVTIRTPIEGFNSPVAHAIVFASLGFPCLEMLASFDKVRNRQDFEHEVLRWSQQAQMNPCMPKPVAFVSMRGKCQVTVPATIARSCKYVVIKLLRAQGSGDNIDVEYVGLHGWAGRRCFPCRAPMLD